MKKFISYKVLISVFLFFPIFYANAQFEKGDKMAGTSVLSLLYNNGNADISVAQIGSTNSINRNFNFSFSPSLGWFVSDATVVGASLNVNPKGSKISYEQNGTTYQSDKLNQFSIGVGSFVRHYLKSSSSYLPFGQFGFNLGFSSLSSEGFQYSGANPNVIKRTYDGQSNGGFYANAGFLAGFTKLLGENAGLDFYLGYSFSFDKHTFKKTTLVDNGNNGSVDETLKNETTTRFINHGFSGGIGFQIFLKKKKK
ncbi:MAG: hypothetical protein N2747_11170 [Chitinophagaceae bacterium]|nr:hypothetical protein [Chitinophagaceae bacterium]